MVEVTSERHKARTQRKGHAQRTEPFGERRVLGTTRFLTCTARATGGGWGRRPAHSNEDTGLNTTLQRMLVKHTPTVANSEQ